MSLTLRIPVGASATTSVEVTRELTVAHYHDHMPEVYGTPMMIYLMELAAAKAIKDYLPDGWGSVGKAVDIRHLAATPVGFTVTARAEVVAVTDAEVRFAVEAHDGVELIGHGVHVRVPVDFGRFNRGVARKAAAGAGADERGVDSIQA